jgi:crotonobetainyl-CoA:carnitine CoA-transferase CaiB-like acyl-CoA transferase
VQSLRVLELGSSIAGAYCGRLLGTTGADVVLLEPRDGATSRRRGPWISAPNGHRVSALHEYLAAGKRSVVLDASDPAFDDALRWADVVVSSSDGDPGSALALQERIAAADPSTVHVALSGFGLTGPYASWRHSPLVDWAAGGYAYLTGDPDREPLQGGGPWAAYVHGVWAAIGAATAVMHAVRSGEGQLVDVGAMEAVAASHQWSLTMYTHTGAVKQRWGRRFGESFHPLGLFQAGDGDWLTIGAASKEQWEGLCRTAGAEHLLADEALNAPAERFERADEVDAALAPWLNRHSAAEAAEALQAARVPASLVLDLTETLSTEHIRARDALVARPDLGPDVHGPAAPFRIGDRPAATSVAPIGHDTAEFVAALGEVDDRQLPAIDLAATRMIEVGIGWAGPLAARTLGDLGVDVVKIERPLSRALGVGTAGVLGKAYAWRWGELAPPPIRSEIYPHAVPGERPWNRMGNWNKMNRSKRSLCLDAKDDAGAEVLRALVADSDLVVHNMTARGARSMGIAPDQLAAVNDRIASVAMTGYGETGPLSTHPSWGPMLEGYAGFMSATGYPGGGPMPVGLAIPDAVGGVHGAFALLAALWHRELTQAAVHVDLAQLETLLAVVGESCLAVTAAGEVPARQGNRSEDFAPQGIYRCDGRDAWVAVSVTDDDAWAALLDLLGEPSLDPLRSADLDARRAAHDAIDDVLTRWTSRRSPVVAAQELQARRVAAAPCFTNRDLVLDPHLTARGFMAQLDLPDAGPQGFPGMPLHFSRTPVTLRPPPELGADNRAVLRRLGYPDARIEELEQAGVLRSRPTDQAE